MSLPLPSLTSPTSSADIDDFVSRAEAVHAAVRALASGDSSGEEGARLLAELEAQQQAEEMKRRPVDPKVEEARRKQREREQEEKLRQGVKGQGARPGYLYFCRRCFREYELEPLKPAAPPAGEQQPGPTDHLKCVHCQQQLITRAERMEELMAKVTQLQQHKAERAQRRQAYQQWKREKQTAAANVVRTNANNSSDAAAQPASASPSLSTPSPSAPSSSLSTTYQSWDLWEPSSDEDESDVPEPSHPEFAALKADMEQREAKKKAAKVVSEAANAKGNELLKAKDYLGALEQYSLAIKNTPSEKSYYTNRALARLYTYQYSDAIKDCCTVMDIYECFEMEHTRFRVDLKNMKVVLKALLRRAKAQIALGLLTDARAGLKQATQVVQDMYAHRKEPEYRKAEKLDLGEITKMLQQIKEKEEFLEEEKRVAAKEQDKEEEQKEQATTHAPTSTTSTSPATAAPAASKSSASSTAGPADATALSSFLSSLTAAHQQFLTPPSSNAASTASASSAPTNWSLLTPALKLLCLSLDSDGNKERVSSHLESRTCIDVLLKLCKLRNNSYKPDPAPVVASTLSLPDPLPNFESVTSLFASSHPHKASNDIWWREKGGYVALGKFMQQAFAFINTSSPSSSPTPLSPYPTDLLVLVVRVLMLLTDREAAREYLTTPLHAPIISQLVADLLHLDSSSASLSAAHLSELQWCASNLVANLAFQPRYRTWLTSSPEHMTQFLDRMYRGVLNQTKRCESTGRKKNEDKAKGKGKEQGVGSDSVLSSGLTALLNLFTHPACRSRFMETSSSSDSGSSPLTQLLSALTSLTSHWSSSSYQVVAGSSLSDPSEKVLSILMNLTVDDSANATIFRRLLEGDALPHLLKMVSQPAETSDPTQKASITSTRSSLSPVLVERALGVLTRGLRREHNTTGSTPPSARPMRALMNKHAMMPVLCRILTLHQYASQEENLSAESVLANLQAKEASADDKKESAASSSSSATLSFRYTRLTMEHASVCLAVLMSQDPATSKQVASFSWQGVSGLQMLVSLLSSPHINIKGNACLCLDGLTSLPDLLPRPELSAALPLLLSILKDASCASAHQNAAKAAIVIGRSPNNAEAWTRMRGLEIIAQRLAPTMLKK